MVQAPEEDPTELEEEVEVGPDDETAAEDGLLDDLVPDEEYDGEDEDYEFEPSSPVPAGYFAASAYPSPPRTRLALLVTVYAIGVLLFLAIEPTKPWILLAVTALVALGADGVLRTHPRGDFEGDPSATAPYLFLPALFTLGSGLFMEDVLAGYLALPGVIGGSALIAAIMYADHISIDPGDDAYPFARLVLNIGTYLTAFGFFAVVYTFDVSLVPAAIAVGLVTLLLSVEVLREAEADPVRALVYAGVVGLVVAEARWGLYFLPLESYLAAVFLLLVFYLASGLVQHHLSDDLGKPVVLEFVGIAILGVLIVALGRIFESSGSL